MDKLTVGDRITHENEPGIILAIFGDWAMTVHEQPQPNGERIPEIVRLSSLKRRENEMQQFKVGDQIECGQLAVITGHVLCIDEGIAWVKPTGSVCDSRVPFTCEVKNLRHVEVPLMESDRVIVARSNLSNQCGTILAIHHKYAWVYLDDTQYPVTETLAWLRKAPIV